MTWPILPWFALRYAWPDRIELNIYGYVNRDAVRDSNGASPGITLTPVDTAKARQWRVNCKLVLNGFRLASSGGLLPCPSSPDAAGEYNFVGPDVMYERMLMAGVISPPFSGADALESSRHGQGGIVAPTNAGLHLDGLLRRRCEQVESDIAASLINAARGVRPWRVHRIRWNVSLAAIEIAFDGLIPNRDELFVPLLQRVGRVLGPHEIIETELKLHSTQARCSVVCYVKLPSPMRPPRDDHESAWRYWHHNIPRTEVRYDNHYQSRSGRTLRQITESLKAYGRTPTLTAQTPASAILCKSGEWRHGHSDAVWRTLAGGAFETVLHPLRKLRLSEVNANDDEQAFALLLDAASGMHPQTRERILEFYRSYTPAFDTDSVQVLHHAIPNVGTERVVNKKQRRKLRSKSVAGQQPARRAAPGVAKPGTTGQRVAVGGVHAPRVPCQVARTTDR